MEKITNKVLDNGLRVIIVENKNKYTNKASIIINSGGNSVKYIKDNKEYKLKHGLAHFLEHYLIEKAQDGNMGKYFSSESIGFNGVTSGYKTEFYISTVHNFITNLKKLIKMVNKPIFKENDVLEVKKPIIEEIKRAEDDKYRIEDRKIMRAFYNNIESDINLGTIDDVNNITVQDLEEFYNAFYRPSNEIISIYTNIDTEKILSLIEKEYSNIKDDKLIKEVIPKESSKVNKNSLTLVDKDEDEFIELLFKIDVKDIGSIDRIKLDGYVDYFLKVNFGEESALFKDLIDNKQTLYGIGKHFSFVTHQDIMYISIKVYVLNNSFDLVRDKIISTINNIKYNKEDFIVWNNNNIISYINGDEGIYFKNYLILDSLINYNCDYLETLEDIKKYNLEEAIDLFNKLEFNNYLEIRRIKGE